MSVRFVTNRFIGDYDPNSETIYCHTCAVGDQLVEFEVMDTAAPKEDDSLPLEDKCKWAESFIFVYDITDRYSFDELTRLKFVAAYTHSRMRVNFRPCCALIGNKLDLAEHERMVSATEGAKLAAELGCDLFREISVKESCDQSRGVYEDLWREFALRSPRSPASRRRRKFSYMVQHKTPVLRSAASLVISASSGGKSGAIVTENGAAESPSYVHRRSTLSSGSGTVFGEKLMEDDEKTLLPPSPMSRCKSQLKRRNAISLFCDSTHDHNDLSPHLRHNHPIKAISVGDVHHLHKRR